MVLYLPEETRENMRRRVPGRTAAPAPLPHRRTAAPPHRRTAAPPHRRTAAPPHSRARNLSQPPS
eukprot:scaffold9993_cov42-Phaeocystis_antarctica.AAC.1